MCPPVKTRTGNSTKLRPKFRGLLVVMECCPGDTYKIADVDGIQEIRCATTAQISMQIIFGEMRINY